MKDLAEICIKIVSYLFNTPVFKLLKPSNTHCVAHLLSTPDVYLLSSLEPPWLEVYYRHVFTQFTVLWCLVVPRYHHSASVKCGGGGLSRILTPSEISSIIDLRFH